MFLQVALTSHIDIKSLNGLAHYHAQFLLNLSVHVQFLHRESAKRKTKCWGAVSRHHGLFLFILNIILKEKPKSNMQPNHFFTWISPFSHKLQTRALLSGLLPYKPVSHLNPCLQILNRATILITLLHRTIFKYSGKTNGARASETGLSGKANQLW